MKKYICPSRCKLDRSELKRFRIKGRQALGCPVHKQHVTHVELTCKCGKTIDIRIRQAGLMELCPDCQYARKIVTANNREKKLGSPAGEPLRRSGCVHYFKCFKKIAYQKHDTVMNCWSCDRYEKKIEDAADYIGTGSDKPDILAPVGARAYSLGKR